MPAMPAASFGSHAANRWSSPDCPSKPHTDYPGGMSTRVVLVTGVSRYLGGLLAAQLSDDPSIERVIGVDVVPPKTDVGRTEFVRADIRNPIIAKVIATAQVDTIAHMS